MSNPPPQGSSAEPDVLDVVTFDPDRQPPEGWASEGWAGDTENFYVVSKVAAGFVFLRQLSNGECIERLASPDQVVVVGRLESEGPLRLLKKWMKEWPDKAGPWVGPWSHTVGGLPTQSAGRVNGLVYMKVMHAAHDLYTRNFAGGGRHLYLFGFGREQAEFLASVVKRWPGDLAQALLQETHYEAQTRCLEIAEALQLAVFAPLTEEDPKFATKRRGLAGLVEVVEKIRDSPSNFIAENRARLGAAAPTLADETSWDAPGW